jgi:hypothetical protein
VVRWALAAASVFAFAAAAWGAASPVSPAPDAVVVQPTFRWTLPANETSEAVYVAAGPEKTTGGGFVPRNIVASTLVGAATLEWTLDKELYAGRYWWLVRSFEEDTFETVFSAPTPFVVPAEADIARIDVRRLSRRIGPDDLRVTVGWRTNSREASVTARLFRNRRLLWTGRERSPSLVGTSRTTVLSWRRPRRIRQGTRLRLVVALSAGAASRSATRLVRAP